MLSVNVNVNLNQHYSMIHNNINDSVGNNANTVNESVSNYNQSYYDNNNVHTVANTNLYKRNYFAKKDQPLKLYTDANAFNANAHSTNKKNNVDSNNSNNNNCSYGEGFRNRKLLNSKSNHNLSLSTNNKNNTGSNNNILVSSMETFYDLELKMDKMLKENKTNSKSKKYNITKMIFEEGIKQFTILISNLLNNYPTHGLSNSMNYATHNSGSSNNSNHYMEHSNVIITFLRNILKVYHESFLAFSNENKTLRDKVEKLQNSSLQLDKKVIDCTKQLKEKEKEITSLKAQVSKLTLSLSDKDKETNPNLSNPNNQATPSIPHHPLQNNNNASLKASSQIMPTDPRQVTFSAADDDLINSSNVTPVTKHQEMIKDLNTKNINDLDALYFNDKVEMAESNRDISPKGGGHVPKLNLGVMNSDSSSAHIGLANIHFNVYREWLLVKHR